MEEEMREQSPIKISKVLYKCYRNSGDEKGCQAGVLPIGTVAELWSDLSLENAEFMYTGKTEE